MILSLLLFQFGYLLFLSLVWLLWLGLPILHWIEVVRVGTLVLFQILTGRLSAFTIEYYVGCGCVINSFYYVEIYSLCTTLVRVFIMNGCWILSNAFSTSIEMTMWFLSLLLLMECITFIDLHMLNHPCDPGMNPAWSWCMIFFMCCWIQSANIWLRIFATIFIKDIGLWFYFVVLSLSAFGTRVIVAS